MPEKLISCIILLLRRINNLIFCIETIFKKQKEKMLSYHEKNSLHHLGRSANFLYGRFVYAHFSCYWTSRCVLGIPCASVYLGRKRENRSGGKESRRTGHPLPRFAHP